MCNYKKGKKKVFGFNVDFEEGISDLKPKKLYR